MSIRVALIALCLFFAPSASFAQDVMKSADEGPDISKLPQRGADDAIVTVLMFTDFQCPFCARAQDTLQDVLAAYPDQVRLVHVNHPLAFHQDAHLAAQAALAARDQGRFWAYHDLLFANQRELKRSDLEGYAKQLQLDLGAFNAALDQGVHKALVDAHIKAARDHGLSGTPSFLINGTKLVGAQPLDKFKAVIDNEITRAQESAKDTGLSGDALYYALFKTAPKPAPKPKAPPAKAKPEAKQRVFVDVSDAQLMLGTEGAPVTIVHFGGFQGPFDARSYQTLSELEAANPGTFALYFKNFPLDFHKRSRPAANAALAAARRGLFKPYVALLWSNTRALENDDLVGYARQVGVADIDAFATEMDQGAYKQVIEADIAEGKKAGVAGTPAFFMNGLKISGAQPLDTMQGHLDAELAAARALLDDGVAPAKLYKAAVEAGRDRDKEGGPEEVTDEDRPFRGQADAAVTMYIFCDLEGPFCAKVFPTLEDILAKHPNDVRIVFKHMPLSFHQNADMAARSAYAAHKQQKFWDYAYLCYENYRTLSTEALEDFARQLGLDMDRFIADRDSDAARKTVDRDIADARAVGLSGTPSFLIGDETLVGAQPLDAFIEVIQRQLP